MISYGDVLMRNIRAARSRLGVNQEALAARMRSLGYAAWLRQTVANVEKGRRRVMAEEIFGLAYALETSIGALMRASDDDGPVAFPAGRTVGTGSVRLSVGGVNDGALRWEDDPPAEPRHDPQASPDSGDARPDLLTRAEVAAWFGLSERTVRRLVKSGALTEVRASSRSPRITRESAERHVAPRTLAPAQASTMTQ